MSNDNIFFNIAEAVNDATLTVKGGNLVFQKANDEILDEKILVEMFNNDYINIVENLAISTPRSIENS